jgi:hypothetical protein
VAKSEVEHEWYTCIRSFTSTRECNWKISLAGVQQYCYSSLRHGGTAAWHRTGCGARDGVIRGDDVVDVDGSQHVGCSSSSNDGDGDVGCVNE